MEIRSNSRELLNLARIAFGGIPVRGRARSPPTQRMILQLVDGTAGIPPRGPPRPSYSSRAGSHRCIIGADSHVIVSPATKTARVVVSKPMLSFPYHVRYELIEFAAYMLIPRVNGWVPLHAACVGAARRAILLLGASGAGKSTLSLHCARAGLEFLSEDATFVAPHGLRASGVPNFLHLRPASLRFLRGTRLETRIRRSPVIRRRSGERKYEIDLRATNFRLAASPMRIVAVVVASARRATRRRLLLPMTAARVWRCLVAGQPQAPSGRAWPRLRRELQAIPGYELRRGSHPDTGVQAIASLLRPAASHRPRSRNSDVP
jgi:hypothetical protein